APIQLDTASTMLTSWIGETILTTQRDPAESLDRLTTELARQAHEKTLATMATQTPPDMKATMPSGLARAMDQFAAEKNPLGQALGEALEAVRRVMTVAGTGYCRDNLKALNTPLPLPFGIAAAKDGSMYLGFELSGAVLRVDPAGNMQALFGICAPPDPEINPRMAFERLFVGPDERLYLASRWGKRVYRCNLDGSGRERLAGGGTAAPAIGLNGREASLRPLTAIAPAPQGGFWLGEGSSVEGHKLWRLDGQARLAEMIPAPLIGTTTQTISAVCQTPDGAVWVMSGGALWRREGEGDWKMMSLATEPYDKIYSALLPDVENSVLVTLSDKVKRLQHVIQRIYPDGRRERYAGAGEAGVNDGPVGRLEARFNVPSYMARRPDGSVLLTDYANGLVRQIAPGGEVTTVIGSRAARQELALESALNIPGGVTLDSTGRPVLVEVGAHTVRRLQDGWLSIIAGGEAGRIGWTGRVKANQLDGPLSIARVGEDFFIAEMNSRRISRLYANGELEVVAGNPDDTLAFWREDIPLQARNVSFREVAAVAATPEGLPVFSAVMQRASSDTMLAPGAASSTNAVTFERFNALWRVEKDGRLTHLAGSSASTASLGPLEGRVGAKSVRIGAALGLTVAADGRIFFTDLMRNQVLSLGPDGMLTTEVGNGIFPTLAKITNDTVADERDIPAREASLLLPTGLAFDPAGRLYIAEVGTRGMAQFVEGTGFDMAKLMNGLPLKDLDGRIRRLDADGKLRTLAGLGLSTTFEGGFSPLTMVVRPDGGKLVFVDLYTGKLNELTLGP
ncbi:MAG: hypothetical protein VKP62_04910, partial [Candidatus Sericytochromatia bacterium]|nr:hypothetical protein [Candidatus Sericytochromatia bacterium]